MCAAPGGKTAQLALAGANVTALDRSAERLKLLAANLSRLRLRADIAVADATSFSAPPFDAILIDAPCSATGTIRRHPDVAWTKKPGDVETLALLQTKMLDRAAALTRAGRPHRLLHLLAGARGGRSADRRLPAPQPRL